AQWSLHPTSIAPGPVLADTFHPLGGEWPCAWRWSYSPGDADPSASAFGLAPSAGLPSRTQPFSLHPLQWPMLVALPLAVSSLRIARLAQEFRSAGDCQLFP